MQGVGLGNMGAGRLPAGTEGSYWGARIQLPRVGWGNRAEARALAGTDGFVLLAEPWPVCSERPQHHRHVLVSSSQLACPCQFCMPLLLPVASASRRLCAARHLPSMSWAFSFNLPPQLPHISSHFQGQIPQGGNLIEPTQQLSLSWILEGMPPLVDPVGL